MLRWLGHRQRVRNAAVAAIACVLLAVSQSSVVYVFFQGRRTWGFALALMLPTWLLMAACAPLVVWLAKTYSFAPQRRAESAAIHLVSALVFAFVHNAAVSANYLLIAPPLALERIANVFRVSFKYLFYQDVLAYGVLLAVYLAFHYSDLRAQLADARLTALRAQINPHFLFNTLNAVSTLALQGRRHDVVEMLGRLSDVLRTALDEQEQEIHLSAELAFADDYLAIQRVRFGDRFCVHKDIGPDTVDALVPSLVLQPIIENAVEHGVARRAGAASISISTALRAHNLLVDVSDTGPGFSGSARKEGIGLSNTRARLKELYGSRCLLEYGNLAGGGASVRISIPFRVTPSPDPSRFAAPDRVLEAAEGEPGRL